MKDIKSDSKYDNVWKKLDYEWKKSQSSENDHKIHLQQKYTTIYAHHKKIKIKLNKLS